MNDSDVYKKQEFTSASFLLSFVQFATKGGIFIYKLFQNIFHDNFVSVISKVQQTCFLKEA